MKVPIEKITEILHTINSEIYLKMLKEHGAKAANDWSERYYHGFESRIEGIRKKFLEMTEEEGDAYFNEMVEHIEKSNGINRPISGD